MFDLGWTEMAIIVIIGLIVIGPKDLPTAIRAISRGVGRIRAMAEEFRSGFDEVMREAELKELGKDVQQSIGFDPNDKFSIHQAGADSAFDMGKTGSKSASAADEKRQAAAEVKQVRARQMAERMKQARYLEEQSELEASGKAKSAGAPAETGEEAAASEKAPARKARRSQKTDSA